MSQARPGFSQLALADTPNAVAWARRHTADVLCYWRVPPDVIETARLLVSEMITNAIQHTHSDEEVSLFSDLSPVRTVTLTLRLDGGRLVLLVQDNDRRPPMVKVVGEDAESGRGVFLIEALSERWGYYYPTESSGKVVWSELLLVARDPRFAAERTDSHPGPRDAGRPTEDHQKERAAPLLTARTLVGLREP